MNPEDIHDGYVDPASLTPKQIRDFHRQVVQCNAKLDQRASQLLDDLEIYRTELKTLLIDDWDPDQPQIVAERVRAECSCVQIALLCNPGLYAMQTLVLKFQERAIDNHAGPRAGL